MKSIFCFYAAAALLFAAYFAPAEGGAHRSQRERRLFVASSDHPHGWPGHVVDHKWPLCAGGADLHGNMQWEEATQARLKDRDEIAMCHGRLRASVYAVKWSVNPPSFLPPRVLP